MLDKDEGKKKCKKNIGKTVFEQREYPLSKVSFCHLIIFHPHTYLAQKILKHYNKILTHTHTQSHTI